MKRSFLLALIFSPLSLFGQADVDQIFYSSFFAPADRETFFSQGFPNGSNEVDMAMVPWSGLNAGLRFDKPIQDSFSLARGNFTMGPLNPDPRSSFILNAQAPAVFGKMSDEKKLLLDQFGPSVSVTGRGFFGTNTGWLENVELVFQLSSKIPGTKAWSSSPIIDLGAEDKSIKGLIDTRTAFSVGANFNVVPKIIRVGVFAEVMPTARGFNQLQPVTAFLKSRALGSLDRILPAREEKPSEKPEPESTKTAQEVIFQDKDNKHLQLGLLSLGVMGEAALKDEQFFIGARFKSTKVTGFNDGEMKKKPGAKEVTFFTRANMLESFESFSIADLGLSYSLVLDSSNWGIKKSVAGVCAKVKF